MPFIIDFPHYRIIPNDLFGSAFKPTMKCPLKFINRANPSSISIIEYFN